MLCCPTYAPSHVTFTSSPHRARVCHYRVRPMAGDHFGTSHHQMRGGVVFSGHLWPFCGIFVHSPSPVIHGNIALTGFPPPYNPPPRVHLLLSSTALHHPHNIGRQHSFIQHNIFQFHLFPHFTTHTTTSTCLTTTTPPLPGATLPSSPSVNSSSLDGPCSR
jgi:hypothetical protein